MSNKITFIGVGADGPAGLSNSTLEKIGCATQLYGSERLLAFWSRHPAQQHIFRGDIGAIAAALKQRCAGDRIVVLTSGDPGFFGLAASILKYFEPDEIEVIPHVSSLQLAFARANFAWNDAVFTSAHARPLAEVVNYAKRAAKLGILTDNRQTPAVIARAMIDAGIEDCDAIVAENLETPEERLVRTRLFALPVQHFAALNVLLILRPPGWKPAPLLVTRPESAYQHRSGMITRADIRALSLARLQISETDIVWDIGAGSGSLSIEAAALAWRGHVYSIEQNPQSIAFITENAARWGAVNLTPVHGPAPEALIPLPAPDAVFIGGSGGNLQGILQHVAGCAAPACRVVLTLATIENLHTAYDWMQKAGWQPQLAQASLSYGQPVGSLTRLEPANPIFILSGRI